MALIYYFCKTKAEIRLLDIFVFYDAHCVKLGNQESHKFMP